MAYPPYTLLVQDSDFDISKKKKSVCAKHTYKWGLFIISVVSFCLFLMLLNLSPDAYYILPALTDEDSNSPNVNKNRTKLILGWTNWFGTKLPEYFHLDYCPELDCHLSSDLDLVNQSDALVFHIRDLNIQDLPKYREPWQRYVFLLHESPPNTYFHLKSLPSNFFNWTMTYKLNSDVFYPYGFISSANQITTGFSSEIVLNIWNSGSELENIVKRKKKLGVWLASNCNTKSKRELIIEALKTNLDIDVWGGCGNATACPRNQSRLCSQLIDSDYKFFFAFENTICEDYVTEKFWKRFSLNSVPVVLKRSVLAPFAPPTSFIAVDDFKTIIDFINFLRKLDSDDKEYMKYLSSKTDNLIAYSKLNSSKYTGFCRLCQKLLDQSEPVKIYSDIKYWWMHNPCDFNSMSTMYRQYNITKQKLNKLKIKSVLPTQVF